MLHAETERGALEYVTARKTDAHWRRALWWLHKSKGKVWGDTHQSFSVLLKLELDFIVTLKVVQQQHFLQMSSCYLFLSSSFTHESVTWLANKCHQAKSASSLPIECWISLIEASSFAKGVNHSRLLKLIFFPKVALPGSCNWRHAKTATSAAHY